MRSPEAIYKIVRVGNCLHQKLKRYTAGAIENDSNDLRRMGGF